MNNWTRTLLATGFAAMLAITGCEKGSDDGPSNTTESAAEKKAPDLGRSLGTMTIEGSTLQVHGKGEFRAEGTLELNIELTDGPEPSAVHAWVGPRSAKDVEKVRADAHDNNYHVNVKVPGTVTDTTVLWIEVESKDGKVDSRSIRMR
ncbi:MAG: hypothetical protein P8M22_11960 [Phycisphaerales bacterium]|nr:hypothetical protein [Phycisphaerales bacterium]